MYKWMVRLLGLKGSWSWAVRQMKKGHIVRQKSATGVVRYKLDSIENGRIIFSFPKRSDSMGLYAKWDSANIFLKDFTAIDWEKVQPSV